MRAGRFLAATGAIPRFWLHDDWTKNFPSQSRSQRVAWNLFSFHVALVWPTPLTGRSGHPLVQHACWPIDRGPLLVGDAGAVTVAPFPGRAALSAPSRSSSRPVPAPPRRCRPRLPPPTCCCRSDCVRRWLLELLRAGLPPPLFGTLYRLEIVARFWRDCHVGSASARAQAPLPRARGRLLHWRSQQRALVRDLPGAFAPVLVGLGCRGGHLGLEQPSGRRVVARPRTRRRPPSVRVGSSGRRPEWRLDVRDVASCEAVARAA